LTSAITLAALITFLIAQAYPILKLVADGSASQTTLIGAILVLWRENMQFVAALVFCSTVLFPLTGLLALLYVLTSINAGGDLRFLSSNNRREMLRRHRKPVCRSSSMVVTSESESSLLRELRFSRKRCRPVSARHLLT